MNQPTNIIKASALPFIAASFLIAACQPTPDASAQDTASEAEAVQPYAFTAPDGWRSELVTFPLSFAPELDYQGHGDVRFSPGMFDPDREDFWTYTFIWWLPLDTEISAARLSTDMDLYFTGLAKRVTSLNERELPAFPASARYEAVLADALSLRGRIETLDAFATQAPITLNGTVTEIICPEHERKAILFAFSPQSFGHPNWNTLSAIEADFSCAAA